MSVTEYTLKFDKLANFAHNLVPSDSIRREHFVAGLRARIAHDVRITLPQRTATYAQVVKRALIEESSEAQIRREDAVRRDARRFAPSPTGFGKDRGPGESKRKSSDSAQNPSRNKKSRGPPKNRQGGSDSGKTYPQCQQCKRHHLGECRARACYTCGEVGHLKKDCPKESAEEP